jgi:hypothetical protein
MLFYPHPKIWPYFKQEGQTGSRSALVQHSTHLPHVEGSNPVNGANATG